MSGACVCMAVYGEWCLWVRVGCICVCMAVSGLMLLNCGFGEDS